MGIKTSEIRDAFYSFLGFTRLDTSGALRKAIARGVQEGIFGYTSGTVPALGDDGKYQIARDKIVFGHIIPEDEIDLDSGFLLMPTAFPPAPEPAGVGTSSEIREGGVQYGGGGVETAGMADEKEPGIPTPQARKDVTLVIKGSRDQLYKAWPAIANLADKLKKGIEVAHEGGGLLRLVDHQHPRLGHAALRGAATEQEAPDEDENPFVGRVLHAVCRRNYRASWGATRGFSKLVKFDHRLEQIRPW